MSIKRLALCRSQGRLFVLLRFAGQDVAALTEREGSQAFAHATTSGSCVPSLVLPVDHGRVLALCPESVTVHSLSMKRSSEVPVS